MLKKILIAVAGVVVLLALAVGGVFAYGVSSWDKPVRETVREMTAPTDAATVARGEHLYNNTLTCWMCHGGDGDRVYPSAPQSGGRFFDLTTTGPGFGKVWASNLTADQETGLGAWSDGEIVRTIREGVDREGRLLFPIMESELYNGLSDDDVLALVAYIRTLAPVKHEVAGYQPSTFAKLLMTFVMKPAPEVTSPQVAPPVGATAEYGKYLAWNVAPCAGCHTPRSPEDGQWDWSRPFAGGIFSIEEPLIAFRGSNLTPHKEHGLGAWSEEQFMQLLRTGTRPDGRVVLSPVMPWPGYAQWSDDDLKAVWAYLSTVTPDPNDVAATVLRGAAAGEPGEARGEALFEVHCMVCHGARGEQTPFTSVALSEAATELSDDDVRGILEDGLESMPGFAKTLDASQLADVVAHVRRLAPFDASKAAAATAGEAEGGDEADADAD